MADSISLRSIRLMTFVAVIASLRSGRTTWVMATSYSDCEIEGSFWTSAAAARAPPV